MRFLCYFFVTLHAEAKLYSPKTYQDYGQYTKQELPALQPIEI